MKSVAVSLTTAAGRPRRLLVVAVLGMASLTVGTPRPHPRLLESTPAASPASASEREVVVRVVTEVGSGVAARDAACELKLIGVRKLGIVDAGRSTYLDLLATARMPISGACTMRVPAFDAVRFEHVVAVVATEDGRWHSREARADALDEPDAASEPLEFRFELDKVGPAVAVSFECFTENRKPAAGARLAIVPLDGEWSWLHETCTGEVSAHPELRDLLDQVFQLTDGSGRAKATLHPRLVDGKIETEFQFHVHSPQVLDSFDFLDIAEPPPEAIEVETRSLASISIGGSVHDESGAPIPGATLLLGHERRIATTDSEGNWSATGVLEGLHSWRVSASANGFSSAIWRISGPQLRQIENPRMDFVLLRAETSRSK